MEKDSRPLRLAPLEVQVPWEDSWVPRSYESYRRKYGPGRAPKAVFPDFFGLFGVPPVAFFGKPPLNHTVH
jgi:hypothetical protein